MSGCPEPHLVKVEGLLIASFKRILFPFFLTVCLANTVSATNPETASAIHDQIKQTYSFEPHKLAEDGLKDHSAILDQFWTRAKSNRSEFLPLLRQELADFGNPPFFLYDGSMLLLQMSDTLPDSVCGMLLSIVTTRDSGPTYTKSTCAWWGMIPARCPISSSRRIASLPSSP